MQKDLIVTIRHFDQYHERQLVIFPDGSREWIYMQNVTDETGEVMSWYFHPVFKKLSKLYYDKVTGNFWLPRKDLYNRRAVASLLKRHGNKLAFFKYEYAVAVRDGQHPQDLSMSGLMAPGASLW